MVNALVFAFATACAGLERIGYDSSYIAVEPPEEGRRACIYQREPGGRWSIWMITFDYQLSGALCVAVYPGLEFGRTEVGHGAFCAPEPTELEPVEVEVKESL